ADEARCAQRTEYLYDIATLQERALLPPVGPSCRWACLSSGYAGDLDVQKAGVGCARRIVAAAVIDRCGRRSVPEAGPRGRSGGRRPPSSGPAPRGAPGRPPPPPPPLPPPRGGRPGHSLPRPPPPPPPPPPA